MSRSSVAVIYQPKGAGKKPRSAIFDLDLIADPQSWLTARIGPLASFAIQTDTVSARSALDALSLRLAADRPTKLSTPTPKMENEA